MKNIDTHTRKGTGMAVKTQESGKHARTGRWQCVSHRRLVGRAALAGHAVVLPFRGRRARLEQARGAPCLAYSCSTDYPQRLQLYRPRLALSRQRNPRRESNSWVKALHAGKLLHFAQQSATLLTQVSHHGLQLQSLWIIPAAAAG